MVIEPGATVNGMLVDNQIVSFTRTYADSSNIEKQAQWFCDLCHCSEELKEVRMDQESR